VHAASAISAPAVREERRIGVSWGDVEK
jgi:hypothetical protein